MRHERSGRAFLNTMRNSKTKPPSFFAQHVKSLVISSDVESQTVVEILSVCRGIINFSYWATPTTPFVQQQQQHPPSPRFLSIFDQGTGYSGRPPNEVSPQRMSVLLHENHIYPLKPHFNLVFFSSVTHLSILNSWEDWTTWTHICSDAMPALTHIKFDMNVQRNNRSSRPGMMIQNIQNLELDWTMHSSRRGSNSSLSSSSSSSSSSQVSTTSGSSLIKLSRVANTLSEVLNNCQALRVCILLLRFDADPSYTAKFITRFASQKVLGDRVLSDKTDVRAANWFDSRLVFAHEREPFRYSHAHSRHEIELWKSAETMVNSQRYLKGIVLFLFFFCISLISYIYSETFETPRIYTT